MRFWRGRSAASENVYEHCTWCGQEIRYGDKSVCVSWSLERAIERAGIEVLQSEAVVVLCEGCGSSLDAGAVRQALDARRRV